MRQIFLFSPPFKSGNDGERLRVGDRGHDHEGRGDELGHAWAGHVYWTRVLDTCLSTWQLTYGRVGGGVLVVTHHSLLDKHSESIGEDKVQKTMNNECLSLGITVQ